MLGFFFFSQVSLFWKWCEIKLCLYLHCNCLVYHRGAEARTTHWSSSNLVLCSGQGQLEQDTQGSAQAGFQHVQGWISLSNLCQYSDTNTIEKDFPNVQTELPVLEFVPIAFYSVTEHKPRRSWLHYLCNLSSGIYTHWSDSLWAFSSPGWPVPASQPFLLRKMLQSLQHFCVPLSNSSYNSFVWRNTELDTVLPVWLHQCWGKGGHRGPQPFTWPLSLGPTHRKSIFPSFPFPSSTAGSFLSQCLPRFSSKWACLN